jgi:hypothetical protein
VKNNRCALVVVCWIGLVGAVPLAAAELPTANPEELPPSMNHATATDR